MLCDKSQCSQLVERLICVAKAAVTVAKIISPIYFGRKGSIYLFFSQKMYGKYCQVTGVFDYFINMRRTILLSAVSSAMLNHHLDIYCLDDIISTLHKGESLLHLTFTVSALNLTSFLDMLHKHHVPTK